MNDSLSDGSIFSDALTPDLSSGFGDDSDISTLLRRVIYTLEFLFFLINSLRVFLFVFSSAPAPTLGLLARRILPRIGTGPIMFPRCRSHLASSTRFLMRPLPPLSVRGIPLGSLSAFRLHQLDQSLGPMIGHLGPQPRFWMVFRFLLMPLKNLMLVLAVKKWFLR